MEEKAKFSNDHLLRLSFIASADPQHPYIVLMRRKRIESSTNTVKIVQKKKGVKTTKTKVVFIPAYDVFDVRIGYRSKVFFGIINYKVHNIVRTKATASAPDETWTDQVFNDSIQQVLQ